MHRLRCVNPKTGSIFANAAGKPLALNSVVNRVILPALNCCQTCRRSEQGHEQQDHKYEHDNSLPEWHGWHAARHSLASSLYRLGVPDPAIQRILRHSNVSTTATYYIKTAADDVRNAMTMLENRIEEASQVQKDGLGGLDERQTAEPSTIQ